MAATQTFSIRANVELIEHLEILARRLHVSRQAVALEFLEAGQQKNPVSDKERRAFRDVLAQGGVEALAGP